METYNLKKSFRDIGEYAAWVKRYCGKCRLQVSGDAYGCALLKALDKAITSDWQLLRAMQKSIGLPDEEHYVAPEACDKFISKRAKEKPQEEKAP